MQHIELYGSRSGTDATDRGSTAELKWHVSGSNDVEDCLDYLDSNNVVPAIFRGLVYKSLAWEPKGNGCWEFIANYVHPDVGDQGETLDTGDYTFSFETGGTTVKRPVSIATRAFAKSGETAPNFQGAIGVKDEKGERTVEGCEIGIPALKFSIRKRVPQATLTLAYVLALMRMSYRTNNAPFMGFGTGELLFLGASGSEATDTDPEVTFNFEASPNAVLTIGDISGITKKGFEYLWVLFEDVEDETAQMTVKRPKAVYSEQVYEEADFNELGIL